MPNPAEAKRILEAVLLASQEPLGVAELKRLFDDEVSASTLNEYRKYIEKDGALERRFQTVIVDPPTVEETIEILKGLRKRYEDHHRVIIPDETLIEAAKLSERYITDWKRRSEEHTSELQSRLHLVCRLLLEKKKHAR